MLHDKRSLCFSDHCRVAFPTQVDAGDTGAFLKKERRSDQQAARRAQKYYGSWCLIVQPSGTTCIDAGLLCLQYCLELPQQSLVSLDQPV
jgi:hypothetical protein